MAIAQSQASVADQHAVVHKSRSSRSHSTDYTNFQQTVWQYYHQHGRHDLPWRRPEADGAFDPYKIMVSELMLQQTQVNRVIPKYEAFIAQFPNVQALAKATLGEVLITWQGLGYNRRAKFLWQAARMIVNNCNGVFPKDQKELTKLPGVGVNTAGAIMAYAYDELVIFIETNIRTVYIHHFFNDQTGIADAAVKDLLQRTLPNRDGGIRQWYWALMDYGTYIKQQYGNKSQASKSYVRQSPFHGSRRQVRGSIIRHLSQRPSTSATLAELSVLETDSRLGEVLAELVNEGLIQEAAGRYGLMEA